MPAGLLSLDDLNLNHIFVLNVVHALGTGGHPDVGSLNHKTLRFSKSGASHQGCKELILQSHIFIYLFI